MVNSKFWTYECKQQTAVQLDMLCSVPHTKHDQRLFSSSGKWHALILHMKDNSFITLPRFL
jgi:hypothetical protein